MRQDGFMPNILRGKYGMDMVVEYLKACAELDIFQWEAAMPKLVRLVGELKALRYVSALPLSAYHWLMLKFPLSGEKTVSSTLKAPVAKVKASTTRTKVPIVETSKKQPKKSNSSTIELVRGDTENSEEDLDYYPKRRRADSDLDSDDLPDTVVDNHGKEVTTESEQVQKIVSCC